MRRNDRQVTEWETIHSVIQKCKVCRLAIITPGSPYIVPMNFGYSYQEDVLTLYFHCADEGRKLDLIRKNPRVGFEMDCDHNLIPGETACGYGYRFSSIVGTGTVSIVEDVREKQNALSLLMQHQTGKDFTFTQKQANSVTVFQVRANSFTCKQRTGF